MDYLITRNWAVWRMRATCGRNGTTRSLKCAFDADKKYFRTERPIVRQAGLVEDDVLVSPERGTREAFFTASGNVAALWPRACVRVRGEWVP